MLRSWSFLVSVDSWAAVMFLSIGGPWDFTLRSSAVSQRKRCMSPWAKYVRSNGLHLQLLFSFAWWLWRNFMKPSIGSDSVLVVASCVVHLSGNMLWFWYFHYKSESWRWIVHGFANNAQAAVSRSHPRRLCGRNGRADLALELGIDLRRGLTQICSLWTFLKPFPLVQENMYSIIDVSHEAHLPLLYVVFATLTWTITNTIDLLLRRHAFESKVMQHYKTFR